MIDRKPITAVEAIQQAKLLDVIFLQEMYEEVEATLGSARREVSNLVHGISALSRAYELSDDLRSVYREIEALLNTVENAISYGKERAFELRTEFSSEGLTNYDKVEPGESENSVVCAKSVIEQINSAERRIVSDVRSASTALLKHANTGLFDWSAPFDCEFSVLFEVSPLRQCYDFCLEGDEPMRLRIRPQFSNVASDLKATQAEYNWNIFNGDDSHPLRSDHHGYLVHCLFDHSHFPWQVVRYIREIEVKLTFCDFETAWVWSR